MPRRVESPTDESGFSALRDEWVDERERRKPEGVSPSADSTAASIIALLLAGAFMVSAIALALARYFGWAALAVGMVLVVLYVVIGGGAEWLAGRLRAKDRREAEEEVMLRMRDFDRKPPEDPE